MLNLDPQSPIEFGRYRLFRCIATGGMAQIWLAVQHGIHGFEKTAVLKVILPELCEDHEFVQMFLDEARLAASIDHTNVVRIYDFGEVEGRFYIAMEHLPGEDLASIIQASKRAHRQIPIGFACDVICSAAAGLHFAHELTDSVGKPMNVVHRDVSPSNVIVTYHGNVKLVDFGIARAESNINKTGTGVLKGKVAYLSPEQASGLPLDRRSDVFALGTVLYELLTLNRPFKKENDILTIRAVLEEPISPPSMLRADIPKDLDAIVLKAMSRDLEQRYATAEALASDLESFLTQHQYPHSERAVAGVMSELFDADRRLGKLRVTQSAAEGAQKTPSALRHLSPHFTPIRGSPSEPSIPIPARHLETTSPGAPRDTPEPHSSRSILRKKRRGRNLAYLSTAAALSSLLLGVGIVMWKKENPPEETVPIAESHRTTRPTPPVEAPAPEAPTHLPADPPAEPDPDIVRSSNAVVAMNPPPARAPAPTPKGKLTLDTAPWSEVFLKGRKLGDTPIVDYSLPAGLHVLTLVNEEKNLRTSIEVEVAAGKTTVKKLKL